VYDSLKNQTILSRIAVRSTRRPGSAGGEGCERGDARARQIEREREPPRHREPDADPREAAGAETDGEPVEVRRVSACLAQQCVHVLEQRLRARDAFAEQLVVEVVAEGLFELLEVLHGVRPLPLGGLPLLGRDVPVAREPGPVRLDELTLEGIPEGLGRSVGVGLAMAGSNVRRLRLELDGHFGHPPRGSPSRG